MIKSQRQVLCLSLFVLKKISVKDAILTLLNPEQKENKNPMLNGFEYILAA